MSFGLNIETVNQFSGVFAKYPQIDEVIIYGSRAKGNYRDGSDIDLTIKGKNLDYQIVSKVWLDLDALNTPYMIDISVHDQLKSKNLREHIRRVGKTFYKISQSSPSGK